jgi:hypothetical protein
MKIFNNIFRIVKIEENTRLKGEKSQGGLMPLNEQMQVDRRINENLEKILEI